MLSRSTIKTAPWQQILLLQRRFVLLIELWDTCWDCSESQQPERREQMEPWMKKCCLTYFVFTVETFLFIVDSFFRIGFNMSVACFCKSVTSRSPPRPDPGHLRTRVSMCFHRGESPGFVKKYIFLQLFRKKCFAETTTYDKRRQSLFTTECVTS